MNVYEKIEALKAERAELARTDEKLMQLAGFLAAIEERAHRNERTEHEMMLELRQEYMLNC